MAGTYRGGRGPPAPPSLCPIPRDSPIIRKQDVGVIGLLAVAVLVTLLVITVHAPSEEAGTRSCGSVFAPADREDSPFGSSDDPGPGPFGSTGDAICDGHRWVQAHRAVAAGAITFGMGLIGWGVAVVAARRWDHRGWLRGLGIAVGAGTFALVVLQPVIEPGDRDPCGNLLVAVGEVDQNPDGCTSAKTRQVITGLLAGVTTRAVVGVLGGAATRLADERRRSSQR